MKRKKVAITLAYLQNNLGDDLFIEHLCNRYPNVDFYAMEMNHRNASLNNLKNLYFSKKMKKFFKEFGMQTISKKAKKFYAKFDACVMIGGSIFMQDNQFWRSKLRSFKNRVSLNPNTFVLGANFGPFVDPKFLLEFKWAFTKLKDLCFRDSFSASFFPDSQKIRYEPDILFGYNFKQQEEKKQIAISVINPAWGGRPEIQQKRLKPHLNSYVDKIVELCSAIYKKDYQVSLVSFCERQGDLNIAQMIESKCLQNGVTNIKVVEYGGESNNVLKELSASEAIVATRFHAMVLGFMLKKTVFPIIYDPKQKYILQDLNFCGEEIKFEEIENLDVERTVNCLINKSSKNSYAANKQKIEHAIENSYKQFKALDEVLKNGEV